MPFGRIVTYADAKTGWTSSPAGFAAAPPPQVAQIAFETFRIWFRLMNSDGLRDIGEGKTEITDAAGHKVTLTFDPKTGLPATETYLSNGNPNGPVEETYADWREVSGVKLPHSITLKQGGKHFADITVTSVKLNQGLTPEQLSQRPEPSAKPLRESR